LLGHVTPPQQSSPALHALPLRTQQMPVAAPAVPQATWPTRYVPPAALSQQSLAVRQAPFT
jgi:hypothetical protein